MPTPTDRPSLSKDLETRYASQHTGGAFDSKALGTGVDFGLQEKFWTKAGFPAPQEERLGFGGTKQWTQTRYRQGFSDRKYKK
jgi:hypothetical protein